MHDILRYNFHSHTYRCSHAVGDIDDYVKKALEENFLFYGVSDHIMLPEVDQLGIRGNYQFDYPSYLDSYRKAKEKYQGKINLFLGFEVEYYAPFISYYQTLLKEKIDYLILGQHFHMTNDKIIHSYHGYSNGDKMYVEDMIMGMKTGLILYVAHPDLLVYFHSQKDDELRALCHKIIDASKRTNTPLELNVSKVEINRLNGDINPKKTAAFPLDMFWELAGKEQVNVVIGLDAHAPQFVNSYGFNYGLEYAKKYNLKVMNQEEIITRMSNIKSRLNK